MTGGHASRSRRRLLVPEVVQTSAMDCGPAALKCLLEGFGIHVSYDRLREACQTDVDGTSINALEDIANGLGLEAEQLMVPMDHLLLPKTEALPAIVVVRLASGLPHFVVVWSCHGPLVQVMDPAMGRWWPTRDQLLTQVLAHSAIMHAEVCRDLCFAEEFTRPLGFRLNRLGLPAGAAGHLSRAMSGGRWRDIAALDAVTRLVESMWRTQALRAGGEASRVLDHLLEQCRGVEPGEHEIVTPPYWTMLPAPPAPNGCEQVFFRGAVLIRAVQPRPSVSAASFAQPGIQAEPPPALSPELAAALAEPPPRPGRVFLGLLRDDGPLALFSITTSLAVVALGAGMEALLFRGLFELGDRLGLVQQRIGALALLTLFLLGLLLLEASVASGLFRLGRHLDTRLRIAFLHKIPRLGDRYLQSRPLSDMAERGHNLYMLHLLLRLGGQMVRCGLEIGVTTAGLIWLGPAGPLPTLLGCLAIVAVPLLSQPPLIERDLRVRVHTGSLCRFYLDALLGLIAVRAHGAEHAVRHEHEGLLVEWARAGRGLQRTVVLFEGIQALVAFGLVGWLVHGYLLGGSRSAGVLLFAYWAMQLPALGQELALLSRQYPIYRNVALRLLEPLGALSEEGSTAQRARGPASPLAQISLADCGQGSQRGATEPQATEVEGTALELRRVTVIAAGQAILKNISLTIQPGSHLGIVGPSGAGKSSLVGVFLGWHRAAAGEVLVDGAPLSGERLEQVRRETAWVDPAVQLWNRTLLDNLCYGLGDNPPGNLGQILDDSDLLRVLNGLPAGLQTILGEGGGLMSGGEGQRVRLGRAMLRSRSRLVILDEAFRGLDRKKRQALLARARHLWARATLLCITHDVSDTLDFERVIVVEGGGIAESGAPAELMAKTGSRYRALVEAEERVRRDLWENKLWRHLRIDGRGSRHDLY